MCSEHILAGGLEVCQFKRVKVWGQSVERGEESALSPAQQDYLVAVFSGCHMVWLYRIAWEVFIE
jgi:hypothetical protein